MGKILSRRRRHRWQLVSVPERELTGLQSGPEDVDESSDMTRLEPPEPILRAPKGGRPRLDHRPGFARRFAQVLRSLERGETSKAEAASLLGISRRSVNRYMKLAAGHVG